MELRTSMLCAMACLFALIAANAAQAQTPQPTQADASVLTQVPGDAVAVLVVPGVDRSGQVVKDMVLKVLGPMAEMIGKDTSAMDFLKKELPLGEGFDPTGSFAVVVQDPREHSREWVAGRPHGPETRGPEMDEVTAQYPLAFIVPVTDAEKLFDPKEVKCRREGKYLLYDRDLWGLETGKYVILAPRKQTLENYPAGVNYLTRLTAQDETMVMRDHVWFRADWQKLRELAEANLLPAPGSLFYAGLPGFYMLGTPVGYPMAYLYFTRGENLSEASTFSGGVQFTGGAIRIEARWRYPEDSHMGRALAAWRKPDGPLIRRIPAQAGVWAYGADKSFRTPPALKERNYRKLVGRLKDLEMGLDVDYDKMANELVSLVSSLQGQVHSVEHYAGLSKPGKEGSLAFATVAKVDDAAKVLKLAPGLAEQVVKTPVAMMVPGTLAPSDRTDLGGPDVKVIQLVLRMHGQDQPLELPEPLVKTFGDKHARLFVAAVGKDTVVTSFGGGEEFLQTVIAAARGQAKTFEIPQAWREVERMLPENRAAETYFSSKRMIGMYRLVVGTFAPEVLKLLPEHPYPAPVGGALVVDGRDMALVGIVPYDVPKGFIMMQREAADRAMGEDSEVAPPAEAP
jgi:hypothetical protein